MSDADSRNPNPCPVLLDELAARFCRRGTAMTVMRCRDKARCRRQLQQLRGDMLEVLGGDLIRSGGIGDEATRNKRIWPLDLADR